MKTFKIVITEAEEYVEDDRVWKLVADTGNERDNGAIYEYVVLPDVAKTRTRTLLEQTVDKLDLTEVLCAVNGIK